MVPQFISNLQEDKPFYNKVVDELNSTNGNFSSYLQDKKEYDEWRNKHPKDILFKQLVEEYIKDHLKKIKLQLSENNIDNKPYEIESVAETNLYKFNTDPIQGYVNTSYISYNTHNIKTFLNLLVECCNRVLLPPQIEQSEDNAPYVDSEHESIKHNLLAIHDAIIMDLSEKKDDEHSAQESIKSDNKDDTPINLGEDTDISNSNCFSSLCKYLFSSCLGDYNMH